MLLLGAIVSSSYASVPMMLCGVGCCCLDVLAVIAVAVFADVIGAVVDIVGVAIVDGRGCVPWLVCLSLLLLS